LSSTEKFIAILNDLMCPANQINIVAIAELCDNVLSKGERNSSVVLTPLLDLFIGI
jgi:2-phospho-L-lactate transferase/gluconeogenesis factor (CofD/UPF0052 family)